MADLAQIKKTIKEALAEDLDREGDVTTVTVIPDGMSAKCAIRARKDGVVAGLEIAKMIFEEVDSTLETDIHVRDGDKVTAGQPLMTVEGDASSILSAERTALNFLTHLSGIATLTRRYVEAVKGTKAKIYDTRKTLPGLRALEKYAVEAGGGCNHRMGLYDAILIKDNHIAAAGSITAVLERAKDSNHMVTIEVNGLAELEEVLSFVAAQGGGVDIALLDNMDIETLKKAVEMAAGKVITEASGGITLENVRAIAESGVDRISVGALTHSAPALDIGLDFNG